MGRLLATIGGLVVLFGALAFAASCIVLLRFHTVLAEPRNRPCTPASPVASFRTLCPGAGAVPLRPTRVELAWTREDFGNPPHCRRRNTSIDPALRDALPETDITAALRACTCAVVGSSGVLLRSGYGAATDGHDVVMRFNGAPAGGTFVDDVGARTTLAIIADVQGKACIGDRAPDGSSRPGGCHFYADAGVTTLFIPGPDMAPKLLAYIAREPPHSAFLRSDAFADYVDSQVPAFANGSSHPTSGFNGALVALALCAAVDFYGFGTPREHYFSPARPEKPGSQHLYRTEHAWLTTLEEAHAGRVRVWR